MHNSQSSPHQDAGIKGDNYLSIASGKQKGICSYLSLQVTETIERNRHILKAIIDVIVLCGQQNVALGGMWNELAASFICFNFVPRLTLFLHFSYSKLTK